MDQLQIDELLKYCPVCGRRMLNLFMPWGKGCPLHGEVIVQNVVSEDGAIMLTVRFVIRERQNNWPITTKS